MEKWESISFVINFMYTASLLTSNFHPNRWMDWMSSLWKRETRCVCLMKSSHCLVYFTFAFIIFPFFKYMKLIYMCVIIMSNNLYGDIQKTFCCLISLSLCLSLDWISLVLFHSIQCRAIIIYYNFDTDFLMLPTFGLKTPFSIKWIHSNGVLWSALEQTQSTLREKWWKWMLVWT